MNGSGTLFQHLIADLREVIDMDADEIFEMYDELEVILRRHGLQIGTMTGTYSNPICLKITIEERDKEVQNE